MVDSKSFLLKILESLLSQLTQVMALPPDHSRLASLADEAWP